MKLAQQYQKYVYAKECYERYIKRTNLGFGQLEIECPVCKKIMNVRGSCSHQKVHMQINQAKRKVVQKFIYTKEILTKCAVCGKQINAINDKGAVNSSKISTCSLKCSRTLYGWIKKYQRNLKNCPICGKQFISKYNKTCSIQCSRKYNGQKAKKWHNKMKNTDTYKDIQRRIGESRREFMKGKYYPAWNKGLTGQQYVSHYDKEDGSNSLYESIKRNNSFFKKTKPQILFQEIMKEINIQYDYSIFINNSQFDFLLKIDQKRLVVQVDGDWWHKSILKCSDQNERKMCRLKDSLKAQKVKTHRNGWDIVRVWQLDIYNNSQYIKQLFKKLKEREIYDQTIHEIKQYYNKKG